MGSTGGIEGGIATGMVVQWPQGLVPIPPYTLGYPP